MPVVSASKKNWVSRSQRLQFGRQVAAVRRLSTTVDAPREGGHADRESACSRTNSTSSWRSESRRDRAAVGGGRRRAPGCCRYQSTRIGERSRTCLRVGPTHADGASPEGWWSLIPTTRSGCDRGSCHRTIVTDTNDGASSARTSRFSRARERPRRWPAGRIRTRPRAARHRSESSSSDQGRARSTSWRG